MNSLKYVKEVIDILKKNGLNIPDVHRFARYGFDTGVMVGMVGVERLIERRLFVKYLTNNTKNIGVSDREREKNSVLFFCWNVG